MEQVKRLYETTFIVNASLEDAQIESAIGHAGEAITRNGGEIVALNKWGRKRLAYPIQKKNNGFYVNIEFRAPGPVLGQLERVFLLDENILRFLTVQIDKRILKARAQAAAKAAAAAAQAEPGKEPLFTDDPATPPRR